MNDFHIAIISGFLGLLGAALGALIGNVLSWRLFVFQGRSERKRNRYREIEMQFTSFIQFVHVCKAFWARPLNYPDPNPRAAKGQLMQAATKFIEVSETHLPIYMLTFDTKLRKKAQKLQEYENFFLEFAARVNVGQFKADEPVDTDFVKKLLSYSDETEELIFQILQHIDKAW